MLSCTVILLHIVYIFDWNENELKIQIWANAIQFNLGDQAVIET